jgi:hypothetical protein
MLFFDLINEIIKNIYFCLISFVYDRKEKKQKSA